MTGCSTLDGDQKLKHGVWQEFYMDGQLMDSTEYRLGEKVGVSVSYYPTGKLQKKIVYDSTTITIFYHYKMGTSFLGEYISKDKALVPHGHHLYYNRKHQLTDSIFFQEGQKRIEKSYHPSKGYKQKEIQYADSQVQRTVMYFSPKGKMRRSVVEDLKRIDFERVWVPRVQSTWFYVGVVTQAVYSFTMFSILIYTSNF